MDLTIPYQFLTGTGSRYLSLPETIISCILLLHVTLTEQSSTINCLTKLNITSETIYFDSIPQLFVCCMFYLKQSQVSCLTQVLRSIMS